MPTTLHPVLMRFAATVGANDGRSDAEGHTGRCKELHLPGWVVLIDKLTGTNLANSIALAEIVRYQEEVEVSHHCASPELQLLLLFLS